MFLYEMHMHTKEISACARTNAAEMVRCYHKMGFAGVFITDHFLNGNTTVDRSRSWEKQVNDFFIGYELAVEEGEKLGMDVFAGWEYSFHGNDFLTYGLDKKWLLANPQIMDMTVPEYCDFCRQEGGFIVHAHPVREADYIDMIRLLPRNVDAVEVYNANRSDFDNKLAVEYADNYGLLKSAGTDNHVGIQEHIGGLAVDKRIASDREMIENIRNGSAYPFKKIIENGVDNHFSQE